MPKSILKSTGPSPAVTRSKTSHIVFGKARPMSENQLPLKIDIKRDLEWRKHLNPNVKNFDIFYQEIAKELHRIWHHNSVPTLNYKGIIRKVREFFRDDPDLNEVRQLQSRKMNDSLWVQKKIDNLNVLFDLCSCKCFTKCRVNLEELFKSSLCKCPDQRKIKPF